MADAPKEYIDGLLKAIVGIEIEITRIVGKSKVSRQIALFELDRDSPPQAVCGRREDQRKRCGFLEINGKTVHFLTRPHRKYSR